MMPVNMLPQVQGLLSSLELVTFRTDRFNAAVISTLGTDWATLVITAVLLVLAAVQARAGRTA